MYNLNKPFKPFHSKKGALELSINAIVILILAITMLTLGLAFMKGLFKKTTSQLETVGKDIEKQALEQLKSSPAKVTLQQETIDIPRDDRRKTIPFAIKNVESKQKFTVVASCTSALEGSPIPANNLKILFDKELDQGVSDVGFLQVDVDAGAAVTTHSCQLCVSRGGGSDCGYATKSFFITVV